MALSNRYYGCALRCYDNGGETFDRYTILPPHKPGEGMVEGIGASREPFHPQGYGQHITAQAGTHLGRRIPFACLPPDVQRFARQEWPEHAPPENAHA